MNINCKSWFVRSSVLHIIFVLLGCSALSSCATYPNVELITIDSPDDMRGDEIDTFFLRKSLIKIDAAAVNSQETTASKLEITSLLAEHSDFKIGLRKAGAVGVRTNLNITKLDNTALVDQVGVEVEDKRVETINKLGAIVKNVLPLGLAAPRGFETIALPQIIDVNQILNANGIKREPKKDVYVGNGVKIDFEGVPPDALDVDKFISRTPVNFQGIVYSACRSATVKFQHKGQKFNRTIKVNDPRYLQRVAFPTKGKISFHSICGVSVTSEKETGISTSTDIIDALVAQGKSIKEAIDAAKKPNK